MAGKNTNQEQENQENDGDQEYLRQLYARRTQLISTAANLSEQIAGERENGEEMQGEIQELLGRLSEAQRARYLSQLPEELRQRVLNLVPENVEDENPGPTPTS